MSGIHHLTAPEREKLVRDLYAAGLTTHVGQWRSCKVER